MKTAIIGAGASGLLLANLLKDEYVLIEKADRVGKKLLATGNGKCNLTNINISPDGYNAPEFVAPFLEKFPPSKTVSLFNSLGLLTAVKEDGKVYPYSESAATVLNVLRRKAVNIITSDGASKIEKISDGYKIHLESGKILTAKNVVLCSGSSASGGYSSLELFKPFGHKFFAFKPSLCPILTDRESVKGLGGIRVKATLHFGDASEYGEILFKDYGLSGIASFNVSSLIARGKSGEMFIDFLPQYSQKAAHEILKNYSGIFHTKVSERIHERAKSQKEDVLKVIKHYIVKPIKNADFSLSQVCCGGLDTLQFDFNLESLLSKGLFAAGEALNVDGICGGYNLQWAWSSAMAVAQKINSI